MTQMNMHHLERALHDRRLARRARRLMRNEAGRPGSEQLRLYAARLETAARTLERSALAERPRQYDGIERSGTASGRVPK